MAKILLGWPLPKRQELFVQLGRSPTATQYETKIEFMGEQKVLPVWRIPIDAPRYRLMNGRTSSLQEEWLANHPEVARDFFTADPERDDAQRVQHELLQKLIGDKDLESYFIESSHKQQGYLILDYLGYVINGNRRLCAWRELLSRDPTKYGHFSNIDVVVLPPADEEAIDRLESQLQLEPDILADYSWHAEANMFIRRLERHRMTVPELAKFYKRRPNEIEELIEMRKHAAEYLRARGREGMWSEVTDEFAFRQMVNKRKQISSIGDKRLFEVGTYLLLDDPTGGRLYEQIPQLFQYRKEVRARLAKEFGITAPESNGENLLGENTADTTDLALAQEIDRPDNRERAREIIKEVIETQEFLTRERNSSQYILRQLQKANAAVESALTALHRTDVDRKGLPEVVENIEAGLKKLRRWLDGHG